MGDMHRQRRGIDQLVHGEGDLGQGGSVRDEFGAELGAGLGEGEDGAGGGVDAGGDPVVFGGVAGEGGAVGDVQGGGGMHGGPEVGVDVVADFGGKGEVGNAVHGEVGDGAWCFGVGQ